MSKFVKERSFYKELLRLAVPVAMQNLLGTAIAFTDNLMVGALGEQFMSSATTVNYITFFLNITCFGIAGGGMVLSSQYWGVKNAKAIKKIVAIVLRLAMFFSAAIAVAGILFPWQCIRLFTPSQQILTIGVPYLRIIAMSYVFSSFTLVYLFSMRSVQKVLISVAVNLSSFVINIVLNYMLIFGKFGAPKLGIQGAAIATLSAKVIEFVVVMIYMNFFENAIGFRLKDLFVHDKLLFNDYVKSGFPVIANELFWVLGATIQNAIIGRLGDDAIAAMGVVSMVFQLAGVLIFGVANAAGILVGKAISSRGKEYAQSVANTMQAISLALGVIGAVLVFVFGRIFPELFDNFTPSTIELAKTMMIPLSMLVMFCALSAVNIVGTLRGGGDVKFGMMADVVFVWLFSIPLGFFAGLVFHLPIPIVYFCLKIDEPIKAAICYFRVRSGKWISNLTREGAGA